MQQSVKMARVAPAEIKPKATPRLRGLDALRGIAALSVVLFHYTTGWEHFFPPYASKPLFFASHGHFGVELFFCISGFVILGTIERTANLRRFAIARLARIYPAYLVCAVLSLAAIRLGPFHIPGLNAGAIALNATMLTGLTGVQAIDPSYWTLSYEILFYAAAALVWVRLAGVQRRMECACLVWLAVSFVGHSVPWVSQHHRLAVLLNIEYANLFVLGMMLYYRAQGSCSRRTKLTVLAALLMALFPPEFNGGQLSRPAYVAMVLSFAGAIWLVSQSGGKFLDIRPLVFLGEISYSLYLIHQMVGYVLIGALLRAGLGTNLAILTTILAMVGVAHVLRTTVEKPAERWIKGLAKAKGKGSKIIRQEGGYGLVRT